MTRNDSIIISISLNLISINSYKSRPMSNENEILFYLVSITIDHNVCHKFSLCYVTITLN